ncbi:MAG: phosphatidate cytidylyltransferase [Saprospiraceae bacterium]|nr:phosphatidate cytidylyltransferase [Saprospiraceae bacterium]
MNKPELITRSITGLLIGIISLAAIVISPWTFLLWLCLIVLQGTREYLKLEDTIGSFNQGPIFPILLMLFVAATGYTILHDKSTFPVLLALPIVIGLGFLLQLLFKQDIVGLVKTNNAIFSATGYIGLPMLSGCIFLIGEYSWPFILVPVLLIWANDIGAYMIGSQWGKRKIAPAISPGKSIEGTIGGGLITLICGVMMAMVWPEIPLMYIAVLSLATPFFALAGDLWESTLKRHAGVKDSGKLLPGHGGILDRYDSLLFVLPVAALAYFIFVL